MNIHSILVVAAAGIAYSAIGALWYSPLGFRKLWLEHLGRENDPVKEEGTALKVYPLAVLGSIVICTGIFVSIDVAGATSIGQGALVGAFLGSISATPLLGIVHGFSGRNLGLWAIDAGSHVASFIVAAIVISVLI